MPDVSTTHLDDFTLLRYLAGELSPGERVVVESHLAACEACTELQGELARLDASLRELASDGSFPAIQNTAELPPGDPFRDRPPARAGGHHAVGARTVAAAEEAASLQLQLLEAAKNSRQLATSLAGLSLGDVAQRFALLYAVQESAKQIAESPVRSLLLAEAVLTRLGARGPTDDGAEAEEAVPRLRLQAQAHLLAGQACNWTKEFDRARSHLELAYRSLGRAGGHETSLAMVELAESQRRFFLGRGHEALLLARRATATFRTVGLMDYAARGTVGEAMALAALGNREEAVRVYRRALPVFEREQLWSNYVGAVNSIGVSLMHLGRLTEARREYARALRRLSREDHRAWLGYIRHGLAEVLFAAGRYRQAAISLAQAARIYAESNLRASALTAMLFEIESWARHGDLDRARHRLEHFEREVKSSGALDPAIARQIADALAGHHPDLVALGELRAGTQPLLREWLGDRPA